MDNNLALVSETQNPLALDKNILNQLQNYEDFLSAYIQLDQATTAFSWLKADLLNELLKKQGDKGVDMIARDLKEPRGTVGNYIRTARAFPPERRSPRASFTLHFKASFADSYGRKNHEFKGDKRFEWLNKAVDDNMSTRALEEAIKREELIEIGAPIICQKCGQSHGEVGLYVIFSSSQKIREEWNLHATCYQEIRNFILGTTGQATAQI